MRKSPAPLILACIGIFAFGAFEAGTASRIRPTDLTCEYVEDPFCIDAASPRLSWINSSRTKGESQTAYQIRVSGYGSPLRRADLWNSGRIESDQSFLVHYDGEELESMQRCRWQVRVWDSNGRKSRWSRPAEWGMGILNESEWKGSWIGAPWQGEAGPDYGAGSVAEPEPVLRRQIYIDRKLVSAKAYVTGLGFFRFFVNGERAGDSEFTPNETSYTHREGLENHPIGLDDSKFRGFRVMYCGYDIKPMLHNGKNELEVWLGSGFFNNNNSRWMQSYGSPRFLGQILLEYADGTSETIVSDESWMARRGPVLSDGMFEGETYDARREEGDDWEPVALRKAPDGRLCASCYTSDKVKEILEPVSISVLEDGSYEVDFGDYISGWVRLRHMNGKAGDCVETEYLCESPGNGPGIYVLNGSGNEEYAPHFTWFVFDKVRVKGYPGELTSSDISAEAVYADVATSGRFSCSNDLFNRINHIWWRSQTDNMHLGVATDCPHREKGPYTGDGEVACVTVMHNFDAAAFYTKWLRDMSDCQDVETGYVPNGAPWHPGCGGGTGWGAAMNIIPWEFYLHYGDRDLLEEHYPHMQSQLEFMRSWITPYGTMLQQAPSADKPLYWLNLGDWLPPFELPSEELVHTYLLWKCTDYTARAARALGRRDDADGYEAQAAGVADAFYRRFYDEEKKSYGDYGSNVMALAMGVPDECREDVIETLREEIAGYGGHLNTGIVGTQLFFEQLADNGLNEFAFEAMNKRDFPSFGWWVEQGAYTTWEQWDGGNSRNHPMFGGALTWFYRKVAGMMADEDSPGYRHIIFKPMPCGDLTWAQYYKLTPYGDAGIRWELGRGSITVKVEVPVGCTATVCVPHSDGSFDTSEVCSGTYSFTSKY